MISTKREVSIICDICKRIETNRNINVLETMDEYIQRRTINITLEQFKDKDYVSKILFDRELGLKMLPHLEYPVEINTKEYLEAKDVPINIFFVINTVIHICSTCAATKLKKTYTLDIKNIIL